MHSDNEMVNLRSVIETLLYMADEDSDGVEEVMQLPSIDIVFCKECKWAEWYKTADGKQFCYCMETGSAGRTADDFCSYGEREGE